MPKVNIYEHYENADGLPVTEPPTDSRRVSVGWAKGTHAQIGIGRVDPNISIPEQVTWAADFMLESEKDESGRNWKTDWVNLDRHMINQLIRELRTARDAAFGRDE